MLLGGMVPWIVEGAPHCGLAIFFSAFSLVFGWDKVSYYLTLGAEIFNLFKKGLGSKMFGCLGIFLMYTIGPGIAGVLAAIITDTSRLKTAVVCAALSLVFILGGHLILAPYLKFTQYWDNNSL